MALNIDLAPTLLALAGAPAPQGMQGMNLAPWLVEPAAPGRRAWLLEHHREFPYNAPSYRGVRTRRYLYVEYQGRFAPTLHDVAADPKQQRNLMGTSEAERVLPELRAMLAALKSGERLDA
jgi:arylsulfatase A-like enzyme